MVLLMYFLCHLTCLASVFVQGEAGTGNVVEAVRHCRAVMGAVKGLQAMDDDELYVYAKEIRAPIELVRQVRLRPRAGSCLCGCRLHCIALVKYQEKQ